MRDDKFGDRMKEYENVTRHYLTRRMPVIIRVDGKAFHSLTAHMVKPYDRHFMYCMQFAAFSLCSTLHGAKLAYVQSDEISVLLTDYDNLTTESCFANNLQKLCSISAAEATMAFNNAATAFFPGKFLHAVFDSRVFNLPKEEVCNYFLWRQSDASRNAVRLLGHHHFSAKQLHGVSTNQLQEMLFQQGVNFNDEPTDFRRGACTVKETYQWSYEGQPTVTRSQWKTDREIPVFSQDRMYIEKLVYSNELEPSFTVRVIPDSVDIRGTKPPAGTVDEPISPAVE